jgi:membrane protease YdiL (CAAX protease family)
VLMEHRPEQRAMRSAVTLYFSLLGVCVVGMVAGRLGLGAAHDGLNIDLFVTAGLSLVTLAWAVAGAPGVLPPLTTVARPRWFAVAVGLSLVTVAIATGTIGGFQYWVHQRAEPMSRPFLDAGYSWGFVVLCTCVQPAVIEELAFRGVIFAGVGRALSRVETVLVTALMFMILHLSPVRFPHTLALGLAAGYLRSRTGSLYPCMALHFAHNLLVVGGERFSWF